MAAEPNQQDSQVPQNTDWAGDASLAKASAPPAESEMFWRDPRWLFVECPVCGKRYRVGKRNLELSRNHIYVAGDRHPQVMCDPCLFKSGMHLDADRIQRIIESDRAERARPAAERAEIKMTARLRARELHSAGLSVREIENQLASENLPGKKSAISEWPRKAS